MTIESDIELQGEVDDDRVTCPLCDGEGQTLQPCCKSSHCPCRGEGETNECHLCDGSGKVWPGIAESIDWSEYKDFDCEHNRCVKVF